MTGGRYCASHSLSGEADQLARLVAKFRLGGETSRAAPSRTVHRQQPQRGAARPVVALKTISTGHSSAAAARQAEPDGWDEF